MFDRAKFHEPLRNQQPLTRTRRIGAFAPHETNRQVAVVEGVSDAMRRDYGLRVSNRLKALQELWNSRLQGRCRRSNPNEFDPLTTVSLHSR